MFGVTNPRLVGPKRTFKFSLYKLMAMRAASYVCELRPALNVPNADSGLPLSASDLTACSGSFSDNSLNVVHRHREFFNMFLGI